MGISSAEAMASNSWEGDMRETKFLMMAVTGMLLMTAGKARAGVVDHETFKGTFAFANFSIDTAETCADGTAGTLNTFVNVFGNQSRTSSRVFPSESLNSVSVSIITSDSCTGLSTLTFGQVSGGFAASATRTATLNATVPLADDLGNPAGTAIVALTLKRTFITSAFNDHVKEIQLDTGTGTLTIQEHLTGKSAEATATGSLVVNGIQFAGALTSAGIVQESTGSVDIQKK
jgi:hypothetical protein